jgi:hypothetical protein
MPFPLLSHQAIVLPLVRWRPRYFDRAALCLGSMLPDVEYLGRARAPSAAHRLTLSGVGATTACTVLATVYLGTVIAPVLAALWPRWFRQDAWRFRALPLVVSALIGVLSHLALDGLTHHGGWGSRLVPALTRQTTLFGATLPWARVLQYALSLGLGVLAVLFVRIRPVSDAASVRSWRHAFAIGATAAGVAVGLRACRPLFRNGIHYFAQPGIHVLGYVIFAGFCYGMIAVAVACLVLRLEQALGR